MATHRFSMFCELHVLPDPDTLARFVDEHRRAGKLEGGHKSTAFRWQYLDYLARTKV